MYPMKHSRLFSISALTMALFCSTTQAGFVTYSASTPAAKTTDFTEKLAIPAFNSALGTLESVVVTITDESKILGTLKNNSASTRTFNIKEDVLFNVSLLGTQLVHDDLNAQHNGIQLGTGQTTQFGLYSLAGSSGASTFIDPTVLSQFVGSGSLNFDFGTQSQIAIGGGGGNTSLDIKTTADSTLTVTYNYFNPNIVPEPASLVMTSLGGLMVVAAGYYNARGKKKSV